MATGNLLKTSGYVADAGRWTIEFGAPVFGDAAALLAEADVRIRRACEAFPQICRFSGLSYDLMTRNAAGRVTRVEEAVKRECPPNEFEECWTALLEETRREPGACFTMLALRGDVRVWLPTANDSSAPVWLPNACQLNFGWVMLVDPSDAFYTADSSAEFSVDVDVWVNRTIDLKTFGRRDNLLVAAKNQPLLEKSLRDWEQLTGAPITEWTSRWYGDQICRYGFKI